MDLLLLPPAIRNRIWRILLTRPCPVDIIFESKRAHHAVIRDACRASEDYEHAARGNDGCEFLDRQQGWINPEKHEPADGRLTCHGPLFSVAILYVSKSIYEETVKILYEDNRFVLNALKSEDIPAFDFSRVKSIHLDARKLAGDIPSLHNYGEVIRNLRLELQIRFAIVAKTRKLEDSLRLLVILCTLGPFKSCSLSLSCFPWSKSLAAKLMNSQPQTFARYNDLPVQLRRRILSFTDLVQDLWLRNGRLRSRTECCRSCCETLLNCFCIRPCAWPYRGDGPWATVDSKFSITCRCKGDPVLLLRGVSKTFHRDALRVLFARSRFVFAGHPLLTLRFLQRIKPFQKLLGHIVLELDYMEFEVWQDHDTIWDELFDYIKANFLLSQLSIEIVAGDIDDGLKPEPYEVRLAKEFYFERILPGLRRLKTGGLANFSINFLLNEFKDWKETYEHMVNSNEGSLSSVSDTEMD